MEGTLRFRRAESWTIVGVALALAAPFFLLAEPAWLGAGLLLGGLFAAGLWYERCRVRRSRDHGLEQALHAWGLRLDWRYFGSSRFVGTWQGRPAQALLRVAPRRREQRTVVALQVRVLHLAPHARWSVEVPFAPRADWVRLSDEADGDHWMAGRGVDAFPRTAAALKPLVPCLDPVAGNISVHDGVLEIVGVRRGGAWTLDPLVAAEAIVPALENELDPVPRAPRRWPGVTTPTVMRLVPLGLGLAAYVAALLLATGALTVPPGDLVPVGAWGARLAILAAIPIPLGVSKLVRLALPNLRPSVFWWRVGRAGRGLAAGSALLGVGAAALFGLRLAFA